ncbi:MAG: hypothetical protein KAI41_07675 [Hyphomicrobiaceae bacterium]|nr:hypothetical protein [Hyphomicrobiaceae bacterium]MCK5550396.1 hypothetical protein [Hyphomicrobiaceae bacterium]
MTHETQYNPAPVIGYGDGLITGNASPVRLENNDWIFLGDFRFNVHPFRSDLGGWPVRWIETRDEFNSAVRPITASNSLNGENA